ncbi:MAG: thioredoxin family protein [Candidatus Hodarchaeota archaeon]
MPVSYIYKRMIREEIKKLNKPVTLKVFTSSKNLQESIYMMDTLDIYQKASNGMLKIDEYKLESNAEFVGEYDIQRGPAILLINNKGIEIIRYLAVPMAAEIEPFVQALMIFTGALNYYEVAIKQNLSKIDSLVIKLLITDSCVYCPTILSICSQFALASEGKIRTVIIDIMAHPDIGEDYNISTVPYLIINEEKKLNGIISAEELLKEILKE